MILEKILIGSVGSRPVDSHTMRTGVSDYHHFQTIGMFDAEGKMMTQEICLVRTHGDKPLSENTNRIKIVTQLIADGLAVSKAKKAFKGCYQQLHHSTDAQGRKIVQVNGVPLTHEESVQLLNDLIHLFLS